MEKENPPIEEPEKPSSEEANASTPPKFNKKKVEKNAKPNKKPLWRKILSFISSLILGALVLSIVTFGIIFLIIASDPIAYFFSTLFMLPSLLLIPRTSKIFNHFTKNRSEKTQKIFRIIKIILFVFRGQVLLLIVAINVIFVVNDVDFYGKLFREISDTISKKVIIPISPMKMSSLLKMIEKSKEDALSADKEVKNIDRYKKRVNLNKLAARNIEFSYKRAKEHIKNNDIKNAVYEIDQGLTLFSAEMFLKDLDSLKFDTLTLFKYTSPEIICSLSSDYLRWDKKSEGSKMGLISSLVLTFNPNHPQLTLLTANKLWNNNNFLSAKESYAQYITNMEQEGRGSEVPDNIRNIVSIKSKFNKAQLPFIYEWALQKSNSFSTEGIQYDIANRKLGMCTYPLHYLIYDFAPFLEIFDDKKTSQNSSRSEVFKLVSNLDLYSSDNESFGVQINNAFIKWAKNNLIPEPDSKIAGVLCSDIYKRHFKDLCRAYAATYLYLNNEEGGFEQEIENFKNANRYSSFYGPKYYYQTYKRIWIQTGVFKGGYSYELFGWWLRRGANGSAQEFWNAIEKILLAYDPQWLDNAYNDLSSIIGYTEEGEDYYADMYEEEYDGEEYEEGYDEDYEGEGEGEGIDYQIPDSPLSGINLLNLLVELYQENLFTIKNINASESCTNEYNYMKIRRGLTKALAYYTFANLINLQLPAGKFTYAQYIDSDNESEENRTSFRILLGDIDLSVAQDVFPDLINRLEYNDKQNLHRLAQHLIKEYHRFHGDNSQDIPECVSTNEIWDDFNMNIMGNNREYYFTQFENHSAYFYGFWKRRQNDGTMQTVFDLLEYAEPLLAGN